MKTNKVSRPGRRTRDEISICMTIEEKKAGMTYEQKLEGKSISDLKNKTPVKPTVNHTVNKKNDSVKKVNETPTQIVILKDKKTIQEILNEELEKCTWDWKYVKINKDFKLNILTKLGKEGWKFAFIHEPKVADPNSKQPSTVCLQKPVKKGK
jgi:hypothetical protein